MLSGNKGCPHGCCLFCSFSHPGQEKGLLLSIPAGSWISTASRVPKKNVVSVCSMLHNDGACCLQSSSRPLCLAWNPNLNNRGMVRLPKLNASKTRSLLYTYCVALSRNAPGWVESRDCVCKKVLLLSLFCWGPQHYWVGLFGFVFFFFYITFSFDVVWWLHPVQAVVESSALPAVSLRHGRRLFAASQARRGDCRGVNLHSCVPGSEFSVLQSHILKGMWMSIVVVLLNEDWVGKSGMFIFHLMPH